MCQPQSGENRHCIQLHDSLTVSRPKHTNKCAITRRPDSFHFNPTASMMSVLPTISSCNNILCVVMKNSHCLGSVIQNMTKCAKKSQASMACQDPLQEIGAPNVMVTDNARELHGDSQTDVSQTHCIKDQNSETHHQNQNLAKHRGGVPQSAMTRCLSKLVAPLSHWCHCSKFTSHVWTHLA